MAQPHLITRVRRSIHRQRGDDNSDRERMRRVTSDLILHLHPRNVPAASLRFTYTFGLGGLAILLLVIMVMTGILLMFAYSPSSDMAYSSVISLQNEVPFGQLIRNLHHWSATLLLVVTGLHLLRVVYTGAYRLPREFNWLLGLALLGLVIAANFTGYLLPRDQLGFWAVTVATSLIDHIPLIGTGLREWLLGGDQINERTLHHFYVLHVMMIPLAMLIVTAFHIWRVRKDGISIPRDLNQSEIPAEKVTTIPHLISRELVFGLVIFAALLAWSTWIDAPLGAAANPNQPPNPTKTAWYFSGIQELLLHVHPTVGAVLIPGAVVVALILLPYLADESDSIGVWFRSRRARWLCALSFAAEVGLVAGVTVLSEKGVHPGGGLSLIALLLFVWLYRWLLIRRGADAGEIRLALFTLLLAAFVTLTVIGVAFRGEDMALRGFGL